SFRPSVTSGEISANKENKKSSLKIYALILSIIFLFTALVGGSVFLIVKHITKTTATTESPTLTTNIFNTDGTINPVGANVLLDTVGYWDNPTDTGTYTAHEIASDGKSIIFPMGYYVDASGTMDTSKTLYWQVTYKRGGFLTIWLTQPYTCAYFNNNGTILNSFDPGSSSYSFSNYSMSQLRDTTKNIYNLLKAKHTGLDNIIVEPSTSAISAWQSAQDDVYTAYSSSNYAHHNGLGTYSGSYSWESGSGTTWYSCLADKMWIPSAYEIFNTKTGSNNRSDTNGLWGVTATDNGFAITAIDDTTNVSRCWLRSGNSNNRGIVTALTSSGSSITAAGLGYGVRPAVHISLSTLADLAGYNINASAGNNCSVNVTKQLYSLYYKSPLTFTYTANTNYYINSLTIDGTTATISNSTSAPSSYTTLTNTQYKAYRSAYGVVTVILYNVSADISISATASGNITFSNSNTSKILNANFTRTTYDTTTATITATYASGYYPKIKFNSNNLISITTESGNGLIDLIAYDYTFSSNVLTLNFSNLPTGVANIPTITLNTHTLSDNVVTVNANNATYSITYDNNKANVLVQPASGYYVTQAYVDNNSAEDVNMYMGNIVNTGNALAIVYYANANSGVVEFELRVLTGNVTLNIVTGDTKPDLKEAGGAGVDVVAVYASNGGEARVTGTDFADDSDTIVCMAVAYAGYEFVNWTDSDGNNLGTALSIRLTREQAQGKVITANFAKANNYVNTETNNTEILT
ncbi:MAG: hypothetical protein IJ301_05260, partial [Clostridia bacterium]|nr:hypothetical protein [Clostridia bacterium]